MADKQAVVNGQDAPAEKPAAAKKTKAEPKPKKTTDKKRKNQLDDMLAEAKNAFGEINTTGERKLRKRSEPARPAPVKKTAAKKKAAKEPKAA
jgi:hypothetical protein